LNPTLSLIASRKSVRSFSDQPVTEAEKEAVLQAAFRAPTAGNLMLYSIIEVNDPALKARLAETCDDQPFIAKSPWVLLFLADYQRWFDTFQHSEVEKRCRDLDLPYRTPQAGDLLLACCDALIAAQTAVIAAEAAGLASCYIGDILENYEIHRQMFDLPPYVVPITLLCLGHPTSESAERKLTPRFDRSYILHQDRYTRLQPTHLEPMFASVSQAFTPLVEFPSGAENLGQQYFFRKFNAGYSVEMTRSVREMLKNWE
jgi:nitroreductase